MVSVSRHFKLLCLLVVVFSVWVSVVDGRSPEKSAPVPSALAVDNDTYINANLILMFVDNTGGFGRDRAGVFGYDWGTWYPYTSIEAIARNINGAGMHSPLFDGGLWVGGRVNGEVRVAVAQFGHEFVPGPMSDGTFMPDDPSFRVYKLYSDSLEDNPNADYLNWPVDQGAPVDEYGRPRMLGDQMLWSVFNDADSAAHAVKAGSTPPLGVEVQQTVWGVAADYVLDSTGLDVTQSGTSMFSAVVKVVYPAQLTGHEYQVRIDSTESGGEVWNLVDVTTGVTVLANQTDFAGESFSEVADGLQVKVSDDRTYLVGWHWYGNTRPLTGVPWGGSGFFLGVGLLDEFYVSDLTTADLRVVQIRWVPEGMGQKAYLYNRSDNYRYEGFFRQNFEVWDVTPGAPVRRINFSFVENNLGSPHTPPDSVWNPGEQLTDTSDPESWDPFGGREFFQIMTSDYSETALPEYAVNDWFRGNAAFPALYDVLYGGWIRQQAGTDGKPDVGDTWELYSEFPSLVPDTFSFVADAGSVLSLGPTNSSIYIAYKLYNKGANVIDSCYVSLWSDPDIGSFYDDLAGCDSLTSTFFCFNGHGTDDQYGFAPPAVGFKYLAGPLVPSPGGVALFDGHAIQDFRNLPMSSFVRTRNGQDPGSGLSAYLQMHGLTADGWLYTYDGKATTYWYSGDPVMQTGDLDVTPEDRRMMGTCGPFTFNPGDSQYVLIRMAVGKSTNHLTSVGTVRALLDKPLPFDLPSGCCGRYTGGFTGNVDCDAGGKRNLADITRLIDRVYLSRSPLCCEDNGNVDGDFDRKINLADITRLIDNVYLSKAETAACQ